VRSQKNKEEEEKKNLEGETPNKTTKNWKNKKRNTKIFD